MGEEKKEDERPSSARRQRLREADARNSNIPTVSNFFPIDRYYNASDKVLETFEKAFQAKRLDEAFVYGMRYCTFCVQGIVHHDYYKSEKYEDRRKQMNTRVNAVLTKLEQVALWMDEEEIQKERLRQEALKRQEEERRLKQEKWEKERFAELERRIAEQKQWSSATPASTSTLAAATANNVQESALAKLQRLNRPAGPAASQTPPPPPQPPAKKVSFTLQDEEGRQHPVEPDGHSFSTVHGSASLPPPLLPPSLKDEDDDNVDGGETNVRPSPKHGITNAPPSYQEILSNQSSYFGPGGVPSKRPSSERTSSDSSSQSEFAVSKPKRTTPKTLTVRQQIAQANQLYRDYLQKQHIQISPLSTYQGRVSGSTNGCTVISACVVSKHLQTHAGITDADIQSVIDRDCVPLLRSIRSKLGLGSGSLIIPSDVHDHMVDHNLLYQHKFVGAAGGNILDPNHMKELYTMLRGEPQKTSHLKAGATLFFREHVISIVKFPTSRTEAVYDLVDSLPTCNGRASRTRCNSLQALKVLLGWYASHKFSDSNITYVERNQWDDSMADFDPRVFQAFVWADLPKPTQ